MLFWLAESLKLNLMIVPMSLWQRHMSEFESNRFHFTKYYCTFRPLKLVNRQSSRILFIVYCWLNIKMHFLLVQFFINKYKSSFQSSQVELTCKLSTDDTSCYVAIGWFMVNCQWLNLKVDGKVTIKQLFLAL